MRRSPSSPTSSSSATCSRSPPRSSPSSAAEPAGAGTAGPAGRIGAQMEPLLVLPLLAFFILLALFGLVLRRAGRFIASTRDAERFRRQIGDLAARAETSLGEICAQVDAVRRGQVGADALADDL